LHFQIQIAPYSTQQVRDLKIQSKGILQKIKGK